MKTVLRWLVAAVTVAHGAVHLLGALEGLGLADVPQLAAISPALGAAWLAVGALVLLAGVMLAVGGRGWWLVAALAAGASQALVLTAWTDAAAGTIPNVLLLLAAGYGYASQGPTSYRGEYRRRVAAALAEPLPAGVVTVADVDALPGPVAAYVRRSGAVAGPRVGSFRARLHGRIRAGADKPWMTFTAEQVNTYGPSPCRLFFMDASLFGLPIDVLHTFVGPRATMRAKAMSIVPVVRAAGPDMTRAETVTLFNDLCLFAPAALVDAPVDWETLDDRHVLGTYTNGAHTVTAELVFNEHAELVDFVSGDRLAAGDDGTLAPRRWTTPVQEHRTVAGRRVASVGQGWWHPEGEEPFCYIELALDDIEYNPGPGTDNGLTFVARRVPVPAGA